MKKRTATTDYCNDTEESELWPCSFIWEAINFLRSIILKEGNCWMKTTDQQSKHENLHLSVCQNEVKDFQETSTVEVSRGRTHHGLLYFIVHGYQSVPEDTAQLSITADQ